MRRAVGKGDVKAELTTAALPGTTLGALGGKLCGMHLWLTITTDLPHLSA